MIEPQAAYVQNLPFPQYSSFPSRSLELKLGVPVKVRPSAPRVCWVWLERYPRCVYARVCICVCVMSKRQHSYFCSISTQK